MFVDVDNGHKRFNRRDVRGLNMLDLKNTVKIEIDWLSEESIELAEKAKLNLENDGWTLIKSINATTASMLFYAKEK